MIELSRIQQELLQRNEAEKYNYLLSFVKYSYDLRLKKEGRAQLDSESSLETLTKNIDQCSSSEKTRVYASLLILAICNAELITASLGELSRVKFNTDGEAEQYWRFKEVFVNGENLALLTHLVETIENLELNEGRIKENLSNFSALETCFIASTLMIESFVKALMETTAPGNSVFHATVCLLNDALDLCRNSLSSSLQDWTPGQSVMEKLGVAH